MNDVDRILESRERATERICIEIAKLRREILWLGGMCALIALAISACGLAALMP